MATQTYRITGMRVTRPSTKIKEAHPERLYTVNGKFFDEDNNPLSITSKNVTIENAKAEGFVLDAKKGILTLPLGTRGRKPSVGLNQDEIEAELKALNS